MVKLVTKGEWKKTSNWLQNVMMPNRYCNILRTYGDKGVYIQLGHATVDGRWINGIDYINPALAPVFNEAANRVWNEYDQNP